MGLIVVLAGLLMIGSAIALLLSPGGVGVFIHKILGPRWLPLVSALRIAGGLLFVFVAPYTRLPTLIWLTGIVAISWDHHSPAGFNSDSIDCQLVA